MPAYSSIHWAEAYTSKITDRVKLVGSTISCEVHVHVQSYVLATDSIGLMILLNSKKVFECYQNLSTVVTNSELGATEEIFNAGYSIDCLMSIYQVWSEKCLYIRY